MPFSIKENFYFCRVSKTAGMYLLDILQSSISDLVSARSHNFPARFIGNINHGDHYKLRDMESLLNNSSLTLNESGITPDVFAKMKKFSVVRNPYTRTLSLFSFMRRAEHSNYTPTHFKRDLISIETWKRNYHFSQADFVCDEDNSLMADMLFKVEEQMIPNIERYLNVKLARDEKLVNKTAVRKSAIAEYFKDPDVVAIIQKELKKDFEILGYDIDDYPR